MDVRPRIISFLLPIALLFSFPSQALELNGVASFTEFGNEIYLAALFSEARSDTPAVLFSEAHERKLEVRFLSDLSRRRWSSNWMQSMAINTNRETLVEAVDELSEALSAFAGNLAAGDQVEIHYVPGQGTAIRINGTTLVSSLAPGIFNLFLSSWIGPVPPTSHFRNTLLGREDPTAHQARFHLIEPTAARIVAVKHWVTEKADSEAGTVADGSPGVAEPTEELPSPAVVKEPLVEQAPTTAGPSVQLDAPRQEAEPVSAARKNSDEDDLDLSVAAILAQQEYVTGLIRKIYSNMKYPTAAVRRSQQGTVRVRLALNSNGSIAGVTTIEEALHGSLNREAKRAITVSAPFAPLPALLRNNTFEIEIPITFRLTLD